MAIPILTTKLYIPPLRRKIVQRPRLIDQLDLGLHRKLTLVCAPAGFGKTTLVCEWLIRCRRPSAWLSVDRGDNDPTRFLIYFVSALQTITPDIGDGVLGMLQSPQPPPVESILTILINEIASVEDRLILVLDDYHLIDDKGVDQALGFVLEHLPPQMHLIISTRKNPHLPLARLRARDQLSELRTADLRFTSGEATGFFNRMMGRNLSAENIAALEARTEGWIAGLQLAAISMQGHKDETRFIKSFTGSHRFVMDYLVEEVLQQQSEQVQTFLLSTAILDRLCGSLCDAVAPSPSASGQETLEYLERANMFIIPLDSERRWFRYHHLFGDLLRQQLIGSSASSTAGAVHVAKLHLRASRWFENNGMEIEAIHHALAAEDFERVADLAELAWPAMDACLQSGTWLGWVKRLPDDILRARPVLSTGYAWALLNTGEMEAGEVRLRDAERWLGAAPDMDHIAQDPPADMIFVDVSQFRKLPASIAAARAFITHVCGDVQGTVTYARQALDLIPEQDHLNRGSVTSLLGCSYWAIGDLAAAQRTLSDGMDGLLRGGNLPWAISVAIGLAKIKIIQGRLNAAARIYDDSIQLAAQQEAPGIPVMAYMLAELGALRCEQGDFRTAEQHLLKSESLAEQASFPEWRYRWCLAQARLNMARGDLDGTLDMLDEAQRNYCRTPLPDLRPVSALKAQVWVGQGRLTEAQDWVRTSGLCADGDISYLREFPHMTLARVLIARYRIEGSDRYTPNRYAIDDAIGLLDRLLEAAQEGQRNGSVLEILVLQALAHESLGDIPSALAPLERALALAESECYVRIFVDEGPSMARLLSEATARGVMLDYTGKLLAAFVTDAPKGRNISGPSPDQPLIEPLSTRELEVLHLISQGLSNRQIGERLFLALATIKGHNRNIFGKLQVRRRTEAVARARELGLL